VLTLHLVHGGLDGVDTVHVDRLVLDHIGGQHGGTGSQTQGGRGDFQTERLQRRRSPLGTRSDLWCMLCLGSQLSRGILSYCKGYCSQAGHGAEHGTSRGSKGL